MTAAHFALLLTMLERHEGCRCEPYADPTNKTTIGIGYNVADRGWAALEGVIGRTVDKAHPIITEDEARKVASVDAHMVLLSLSLDLPWFQALDDVRQMALADLGFNMGVLKLLAFTNTLGDIARHDYAHAAQRLIASRWATQVQPERRDRIVTMIRTGQEPTL